VPKLCAWASFHAGLVSAPSGHTCHPGVVNPSASAFHLHLHRPVLASPHRQGCASRVCLDDDLLARYALTVSGPNEPMLKVDGPETLRAWGGVLTATPKDGNACNCLLKRRISAETGPTLAVCFTLHVELDRITAALVDLQH